MTYEEQMAELVKGLDPDIVKKVDKGGTKLSYVPGWHVIAELNRIFGFAGWEVDTEVVETKTYERKSREGKAGVAVSAVVRAVLTVRFANGTTVRRVDIGAGSDINYSQDWGPAFEKAVKEGATDALKRGARTLGNLFGLSLYDKDNDLHKGREDDHAPASAPEPEPPQFEEIERQKQVDAITDALLELAAKISSDMPSKVTAWLDTQVKNVDRLTEDDMDRLVGTKRHPGVLVKYGLELRAELEKRERKREAKPDGFGSGAQNDTYGT